VFELVLSSFVEFFSLALINCPTLGPLLVVAESGGSGIDLDYTDAISQNDVGENGYICYRDENFE
jgi:hypothetical protein